MKMRVLLKNITIFAIALVGALSCAVDKSQDIEIAIGDNTSLPTSSHLAPSCVVESPNVSRAKSAGVVVRSLVDQITTKRLDSNFLRIDEDLNSTNDGL